MPGETDLHKRLKKEACRWLFRMGYRCIAAEVRLAPLGIIDAVGTGVFRPYHNYLALPRQLTQVCFIECKATRADFLRDLSNDGQLEFCLMQRGARCRRNGRASRRPPAAVGLGKFDACIMRPLANLHYVLAPAGIIQKRDLPPRWGLLSFGQAGVSLVVKPLWQEAAQTTYVEAAIARTLTGDIFRADDRAIASVNRELFAQQVTLAQKIRSIRPRAIFAPRGDEPGFSGPPPSLPSR